jgi:hypothetical protein
MTQVRAFLLTMVAFVGLSACTPLRKQALPAPIITESPQYYVFALVDGREHSGRGRAIYLESLQDGRWIGTLQLFPSQPIAGSLIGWLPGNTGSFSLSADGDSQMTFTDATGSLFVATSGTIMVDGWFPRSPSTPHDTRSGVLTGTFEGTFASWAGEESVRITGGFRVSVAEMRPAGAN